MGSSHLSIQRTTGYIVTMRFVVVFLVAALMSGASTAFSPYEDISVNAFEDDKHAILRYAADILTEEELNEFEEDDEEEVEEEDNEDEDEVEETEEENEDDSLNNHL